MADAKPVMVKVEAIKLHSTAGQAYDVGDTYEVPEADVDNLATLGMAVRVDRVAHAKAAAKAKPAAATGKRTSSNKPRKAAKK